MPSLRDIARHANTSVTTVSLVLNGRDGPVRISEVTRQQVLEAARELGYAPNMAARRLRSANGAEGTLTIGVLLPLDERLTISIRALATIRGELDAWAEQAGRSMPDVLIETYRGGCLDQIKSLTSDPRYNGAILYNTLPADDEWLAKTGQLPVPLVLVQRSVEGHSWVNVDNREMGGRVAAHLMSMTREHRFAIVTSAIPAAAQIARVNGFAERVRQDTGIDLAGDAIVRGAFSERGGYEATGRLLGEMKTRSASPPTGLFVTTDLMAVGALRALKEARLRVPDDVAVVGYDDDPVAGFVEPPLSSVNASFQASAQQAVETLLTLIQARPTEPITHLLDAHLVVRASSGGVCTALEDADPGMSRSRPRRSGPGR